MAKGVALAPVRITLYLWSAYWKQALVLDI